MIINHRYKDYKIEYLINQAPTQANVDPEKMIWKQSEQLIQENSFLISYYWKQRAILRNTDKPIATSTQTRQPMGSFLNKKPLQAQQTQSILKTPPIIGQAPQRTGSLPQSTGPAETSKPNTPPPQSFLEKPINQFKERPMRSASVSATKIANNMIPMSMGIAPNQQRFTQNITNEQKQKLFSQQVNQNITQKTIVPITPADLQIVNEERDFFKRFFSSEPTISKDDIILIKEDQFNNYAANVHDNDLALINTIYLSEINPGLLDKNIDNILNSPPEAPIPENEGNNQITLNASH